MTRKTIQTIGFRNIDNDTFPAGAHEEKNTVERNTVVQPLLVKLNTLNLRMLLATHFSKIWRTKLKYRSKQNLIGKRLHLHPK